MLAFLRSTEMVAKMLNLLLVARREHWLVGVWDNVLFIAATLSGRMIAAGSSPTS
jgi:Iap family predicted aminopeptidase